MIKSFFKNHTIHQNIVKYFDYIFLFNLPFFFIALMVFCLGMTTSYYFSENKLFYFNLSFDYQEIVFFIFLFLFLSLINVENQLNEIKNIKWETVNGKYKKNLNLLYVCPNFISIEKVESIFNYRFLLFISLPLIYLSWQTYIFLILHFIFNRLINHFSTVLTKNYINYFLIFNNIYLLYLSGAIYFTNYDISFHIYNYFLFFLASIPVIVMSDTALLKKDRKTLNLMSKNRKFSSMISLLMLIILFLIAFNDSNPIYSHYSLIVSPFYFFSLFRSKHKDFYRAYSYPIMIMNVLISWTVYPILLVFQLFVYYLSKYYYWHRFNFHFPKFVIEENE